MTNSSSDLGRKVESARLARGWSKEKAAREAGINAITWKRVEDGLGVQDTKRSAVLNTLDLDENGNPRALTIEDRVAQVKAWNLSRPDLEAAIISKLYDDEEARSERPRKEA